MWVDIEDDEEALGGVDVVDFPTLLIARGEAIDFHGTVLPHAQTARQLVQRALLGKLGAVIDAVLASAAGSAARVAMRSDGGERLFHIGQQVVDVLDADRESHRVFADAGLVELGRQDLAVRGRVGVRRERFGVADVDEVVPW